MTKQTAVPPPRKKVPGQSGQTTTRARWLPFILVSMAWCVAIVARLEDLPQWLDSKQRAFLEDGSPVLIDGDGYHYLRYGVDLANGRYDRLDSLRMAAEEESEQRPRLPPLLSVVLALCVNTTGLSPAWMGAVLPVMIGSLLVFPVFWMGRRMGGVWCGFSSACVAALSPGFVGRSQFARFDTDCGNTVLLVLAACVAATIACRPWRQRAIWLAMLVLTWLLWMWWWDTARLIVSGACLVLLMAGLAGGAEIKSLRWILGVSVLGVLTVAIFAMLRPDIYPVSLFVDFWKNVKSGSDVISEKKQLDWLALAGELTGGRVGLVLALCGLCLMGIVERTRVLALSVPLAFALLPFVWFERFVIFGAPVVGWGVGYLTSKIATLSDAVSSSPPWLRLTIRAVPMGMVIGVLYLESSVLHASVNWPVIAPSALDGMKKAESRLPENAIVWSWWDNGYPLMYHSRRGTIEDGGWLRIPEINALPMVTGNERLAANWMSFFATRGSYAHGLQKAKKLLSDESMCMVLSLGPEDGESWLRSKGIPHEQGIIQLLFPSEAERRDVYLYLNHTYLPTAYWWYWYGAQPLSMKQVHPYVVPLLNVHEEGGRVLASGGVKIDIGGGRVSINGSELLLGEVVVKQGSDVRGHRYAGTSTLRFEWNQQERWGLLCDGAFSETLFNSLYFLSDKPYTHFKKVLGATPAYQLWQVIPDKRPNVVPVGREKAAGGLGLD